MLEPNDDVNSLQSHLLIAADDLAEPFARSVVLLVRHNADGALGLILNKRTSASLRDAWEKVSEVPCHRDASIFLGGPCEGPLVALHAHEFLLEMEVMPGLYFCASKDNLERLASQTDGSSAKFFAGYSGWSAGQLEAEIARGSWAIVPATAEHVFQFEDELWAKSRRHVADSKLRSALQIKHVPPDASLN